MGRPPRAACFSFFSLLILAYGYYLKTRSFANSCEMTYMRPGYVDMDVPWNDTPYALLRYEGDRSSAAAAKKRTHPVIFVPGHGGDQKQVRSLGAHVRRLGIDAEVYVIDTLEEPSGSHAGFLWQQARFLAAATRAVLGAHPDAESVVLVAHSYGGLVARTALVLPSFPPGAVKTIFTLGAPHQAPPVAMDRSLATYYTTLRRFWQTELPRPEKPAINEDDPDPRHSWSQAKASAGSDSSSSSSSSGSNSSSSGGGSISGSVWSFAKGLLGFVDDDSTTPEAGTAAANQGGASKEEKISAAAEAAAAAAAEAAAAAAAAAATEKGTPKAAAVCNAEEDPTCVAEGAAAATATSEGPSPAKKKEAAPRGRREKAAKMYEDAYAARQSRLHFANSKLGNVSVVSLGGGPKDVTVPWQLSQLTGLTPPFQGLAVPDSTPLVGFGMDHLALLWCFQLQDRLALALKKLLSLPPSTGPADRIEAMRQELFAAAEAAKEEGSFNKGKKGKKGKKGSSSSTTTTTTAADVVNDGGGGAAAVPSVREMAAAWAASLAEWFSSDLALAATTHRLWLVVPVWTAVGSLSLAAPLLHGLLGVSLERPSSARVLTIMPPPADLFASPALHWPSMLLWPAWTAAAGAARRDLPAYARQLLGASVALYVAVEGLRFGESRGWVPPLWDVLRAAAAAQFANGGLAEDDGSSGGAGGEGGTGVGGGGESSAGEGINEVDGGEEGADGGIVARLAGVLSWLAAWAAAAALNAVVALFFMAVHVSTLPGQLLLQGSTGLLRAALPLLVAYGAALPFLAMFAKGAKLAQSSADALRRAAEASAPGRLLAGAAAAGGRAVGAAYAAVPWWLGGGGKRKGDDGGDSMTGDEQREEFRRRRREGGTNPSNSSSSSSSSSSVGWLSYATWGDGFLGFRGGEARLASLLALAWLALHVESLAGRDGTSHLRPRGLLSMDQSFAHELAIVTVFAAGAAAALLGSFVLLPPRGMHVGRGSPAAELAKYQLLLFIAYLPPLVPLTYGAVRHALAVLARRPSASALTYSSAAALTFDSCLDAVFLLCIAAHAFYARCRRLPLPRAIEGAEGLFALPAPPTPLFLALARQTTNPKRLSVGGPGIDAAAAAEVGKDLVIGAVASAGGAVALLGSTTTAEAVVGYGQRAWRRIWQWRTGETYYENVDSGQLLYPDGGPRAIFEETTVDSLDVGGGVTIGPSFRVVSDRPADFLDVWGHPFSSSRSAKETTKMVEVVERAAEEPEVWLVLSMHAIVCFQVLFSVSGAYHCFSAIGFLSGVFAWRHRNAGPSTL